MLGELLLVLRRIFESRPNFLKHSQNSHFHYNDPALIHSTTVNLLLIMLRSTKKTGNHFSKTAFKENTLEAIQYMYIFKDLRYFQSTQLLTFLSKDRASEPLLFRPRSPIVIK